MAVEIKSGATSDLATVDAVSKAVRVTQYDSAGVEVAPSQPTSIAVVNVTAAGNDLLASLDVSLYKFLSFQTLGTWAGTVTFQASNDNGTWSNVVAQDIGEDITPYRSSLTGNALVKIPVLAKYLRIRCTAYTSGTIEGICFGYKEVNDTGQISATGEITVAAGQTISLDAGANSIGTVALAGGSQIALAAGSNIVGSVFLATDPTPLITDFYTAADGAVNVNSRSIRGQACVLRAIVMTNYTATARHVKIYNTAGVPVAGVGTPVIVLSLPAGGTLGYPLPFEGLAFSNGIGMTMVLGAANGDVTPTATKPDISLTSIFT